jgi:hypothetical protein
MILQVKAALPSLANDFLSKGVSIFRIHEIQHHTPAAHQEHFKGGLPTKPPASLELFDVWQGNDLVPHFVVSLCVLEEEYVVGAACLSRCLSFPVVDALRAQALEVLLREKVIEEDDLVRCQGNGARSFVKWFENLTSHLSDDLFELQVFQVCLVYDFLKHAHIAFSHFFPLPEIEKTAQK